MHSTDFTVSWTPRTLCTLCLALHFKAVAGTLTLRASGTQNNKAAALEEEFTTYESLPPRLLLSLAQNAVVCRIHVSATTASTAQFPQQLTCNQQCRANPT
jgi:hypothetical protein